MTIPVPIRVYAHFEGIHQPQDNPKKLFSQHPIAVGFLLYHHSEIIITNFVEQIV